MMVFVLQFFSRIILVILFRDVCNGPRTLSYIIITLVHTLHSHITPQGILLYFCHCILSIIFIKKVLRDNLLNICASVRK